VILLMLSAMMERAFAEDEGKETKEQKEARQQMEKEAKELEKQMEKEAKEKAEVLDVTEIGLIVVTNGGEPVENPELCPEGGEAREAIQHMLNAGVALALAKAKAIAKAEKEAAKEKDEGRRELETYACKKACRGWPENQCYICLPNGSKCSSRRSRGLRGIETEITAKFLGEGRALQEEAVPVPPEILKSGFWEGYDHEHEDAKKHCDYLVKEIRPTLDLVIAEAKDADCKEQFSKDMLIGCVNLAALVEDKEGRGSKDP